ncbi:hypothetical protein HG531_013651 [Fusarium graminearum]|nr:hypothetical protein HG531_013651 [Fusarium graminearum]
MFRSNPNPLRICRCNGRPTLPALSIILANSLNSSLAFEYGVFEETLRKIDDEWPPLEGLFENNVTRRSVLEYHASFIDLARGKNTLDILQPLVSLDLSLEVPVSVPPKCGLKFGDSVFLFSNISCVAAIEIEIGVRLLIVKLLEKRADGPRPDKVVESGSALLIVGDNVVDSSELGADAAIVDLQDCVAVIEGDTHNG